MNPQQIEKIRIAVAEELGWTQIILCPSMNGNVLVGDNDALTEDDRNYPLDGKTVSSLWGAPIPNYPASLDDCVEFEAKLMELGQWVEYTEHLGWTGVAPDRRIVASTPLQRCIAFLKTRNREI